jgi:hypothetical protein
MAKSDSGSRAGSEGVGATLPAVPEQGRQLSSLDGEAWRGDEHELRLAAAREAGLESEEIDEVQLGLFTEGFKAGLTLDDPSDHNIVLRGRTVLREEQLTKALRPVLRVLSLTIEQFSLRVHDGEFELRVLPNAAEAATPALDSAKTVLKMWIAAGLVGLAIWTQLEVAWLTMLVWGGGLIAGGVMLRRGAVSGRALLGARLTLALAMYAQQDQLILPPSRPLSGGS